MIGDYKMGVKSRLDLLYSRFRRDSSLPQGVLQLDDYRRNFENANLFTQRVGFKTSSINWRDTDVVTDRTSQLVDAVFAQAGIQTDERVNSAGQCLKWCHYLAPMFAEHFQCKAWLTIGQLWKGNKCVFDPSWADFKRWQKHGIQASDFEGRQGVNLHAWITLDTGEIIEPTLCSTLAVSGSLDSRYEGAVVAGRAPFKSIFPHGDRQRNR